MTVHFVVRVPLDLTLGLPPHHRSTCTEPPGHLRRDTVPHRSLPHSSRKTRTTSPVPGSETGSDRKGPVPCLYPPQLPRSPLNLRVGPVYSTTFTAPVREVRILGNLHGLIPKSLQTNNKNLNPSYSGRLNGEWTTSGSSEQNIDETGERRVQGSRGQEGKLQHDHRCLQTTLPPRSLPLPPRFLSTW